MPLASAIMCPSLASFLLWEPARAEPAKKSSLKGAVIQRFRMRGLRREPGRVGWLPSTSLAVEEVLDARKEAGALRARLLVAFALELLEKLALALGQALGRLHLDLDVHVAGNL